MALFGFGKKKEETKEQSKEQSKESCCCKNSCEETAANKAETLTAAKECGVKVLGSGCKKCNALEAATKEALAELHMDANVEHVTDFAQIASYGVMSTPALVIDGKVVSFGKVLKKEEVIKILQKVRG
ncbi:MAG: thioredoxin family protein [Lachnospiraceae bacterium]|nr:thioredoxin family protein [Lachnospiraceae bacterium]